MSESGLSRRRLLAMMGAATLCPSRREEEDGVGGLAGEACGHNRLFGTAVSAADLDQPAYAALVRRECALLTPAWEMKWEALRKQPGLFDFTACDRIAAFAAAHRLGLRGHTLVWHLGLPGWLPAALTPSGWHDLLETHMAAVMGRYGGQVVSWDVVNEAVEPEDGRSDGLRETPWLRAAGPGHIAEAYRLAARFAPGTPLVYNDYGVEHEAEWTRRRRRAVLRLLERIRAADAPLHGFGLQSHLRVGDAFDPRALGAFLAEVRALGIVPLVTEFDIRADRIAGAAEKDRRTADLGRAYLDCVLAAGCRVVMCWGLSDDKSWRAREEPDDRPLPFDRSFGRKPLYQAIRAALAAAPA